MNTEAVELERLVLDHRPDVYRHAYRLTRNHADAEDLTQDVFVRAIRSATGWPHGYAGGWLYRIALNLFRDQLRKNQRRPNVTLPPGLFDQRTSRPDEPDLSTPERIVTDAIFDDDVAAALAALPPANREAVLRCDVDGATYDEIAASLGISRGTVASRISRGRALLRTALVHRAPTPTPPGSPGETPGDSQVRPNGLGDGLDPSEPPVSRRPS